ncbi:aryl-sulfate sulfotransferase [Lactobacillus corticis]|uniref:Arylsulfate sulfotransferase n=1 Tax=Lactobacillus corticis TaxID=2201249 RepID=A0A916VHW6_9LACO|nr:aryl-sulfate sulfotransferase [Lactobacillus corticis]GFZ26728.1 arylsulfate sulfotransferase [Lactobacillus corticis]
MQIVKKITTSAVIILTGSLLFGCSNDDNSSSSSQTSTNSTSYVKSTAKSASQNNQLGKKWNINKLISDKGSNVKTLNYSDLNISSVADIYNTSNQQAIAKKLASLKSEKNYSFKNPLVVSDPYLTNTTGLYLYFKTDKAVKISYTVKAKGYASYSNTLYNPNGTYAKTHEYQLIGAVAGVKNTITLTATTKSGKKTTTTFTYTPNKLQSTVANTYKVKTYASKQKLSNGLFAVMGNQASSTIRSTYYIDNNGVIRGEVPIIGYNSMRLNFTSDQQMYLGISRGGFAKINRLGQVTQVINTEKQGYDVHHDYVLDSDGNIWSLASKINNKENGKYYVEDQIIKINTKTGKIVKKINMRTLLPKLFSTATGLDKHTYNKGKHDIVHLNTIQVYNGNSIIVSSRETSTIIKINGVNATPKIDYMISNQSQWSQIGYTNLLLKQTGGNYLNTAGQHSVTIERSSKLKSGQYYLYMFNNNYGLRDSLTSFKWTNYTSGDKNNNSINGNYSLYYKYLVDENKGTYKLVKWFRVPKSNFVSDVENMANTIVVASGQENQILEYTTNGKKIRTWTFRGKSALTYRTYKYSFKGYYFK